jgi:hypothetical protein
MVASRSQRHVLAFLADEGPILSDTGQAMATVAEGLGISIGNASNLITRLVAAGMVERDYDPCRRRTFRLAITVDGRDELGRKGFVRSFAVSRPAPPEVPPAMPVCGPIGHLDFDPELVRAGVLEGAS